MRLKHHENSEEDYHCACSLRNSASPIEKRLWLALRENAKVAGLKFRRQQAIHPYIVDFVCMEARLLVELDGDSHAGQQAYDLFRDRKLVAQGFSVMRISNHDVVVNVEGVVLMIIERALGLMRKKQDSPVGVAPSLALPARGRELPYDLPRL